MRFPKFLLICFILIFSFTYCEDRRKLFAENIKKYLSSLNKPINANELINSFYASTMILCKTLALNEIDEMKIKFGLSDLVIEQLKLAPYVSENNIKRIEDIKADFGVFEGEGTIGGAVKEEDGKITFALIKASTLANLKTRYDTFFKRECHTVWLFFKRCENIEEPKIKDLTENEKTLIKKAVSSSITNSLLKGAEILKRDDYELYMTAPGSIFSQDKKSVMHFTYFGDIAIGPADELNSILPLSFKYKIATKNDKTVYYNNNIRNFTRFDNYPTIEKFYQDGRIIINNGLFHEFNFIVNNSISRFPRQYINYMEEKSKNGPFILELKKNGNVILYEEKTNKIIWQTDTANKGTGPYNFYLSNNRELILEDSNKNIIYNFDTYNINYPTLPTIYYTKNNEKPTYNGRVLEFGRDNMFSPISLDIKTNNKMLDIIYEIKDRETKVWHEFNGEYFEPKLDKDTYYLSGFSASINIKDEYMGKYINCGSICYTLHPSCKNWTPIACDGERLEIIDNEIEEDYFTGMIIFVVENLDQIPTINGLTYYDYLYNNK